MKKIISLLFVLVLSYKSVFAAENVCKDAEVETTIIFVNGIVGTRYGTEKSRDRLVEVLKSSLPPDQFQKIKFDLAYNKSYGLLSDFYESAKQKVETEKVVFSFWNWLGGMEIMPDVVQNEFKRLAVNFNYSTQVNAEDLNQHLKQYILNYAEGRNVLVVSHSQGNFFANDAYNKLYVTGVNFPFYQLLTSNSFGIVAVATPASFVAGYGTGDEFYTTLHEDLIIQGVAFGTPPGVAKPLISNTSRNLETGDKFSHTFVGTYMMDNSNSLERIKRHINNVMALSKVPETGIVNIEFKPWGNSPPTAGLRKNYVAEASRYEVLDSLNPILGKRYDSESYFISCKNLQAGIYQIQIEQTSVTGQLYKRQISVSIGMSQSKFGYAVPFSQNATDQGVVVLNLVVSGNTQDGFSFKIQSAVNVEKLPSTFEEIPTEAGVLPALPPPSPMI